MCLLLLIIFRCKDLLISLFISLLPLMIHNLTISILLHTAPVHLGKEPLFVSKLLHFAQVKFIESLLVRVQALKLSRPENFRALKLSLGS